MCYFAFFCFSIYRVGRLAGEAHTMAFFYPLTLAEKNHLRHIVRIPHNGGNHHHMMKRKQQKSRSMYEYEIIIILSALHNPSEFFVFIAGVLCWFFTKCVSCHMAELFPPSFLRWWLQTTLNPFCASMEINIVWCLWIKGQLRETRANISSYHRRTRSIQFAIALGMF